MIALLVVQGVCAVVVIVSFVAVWRSSRALDREIELLAASIERLEAAAGGGAVQTGERGLDVRD